MGALIVGQDGRRGLSESGTHLLDSEFLVCVDLDLAGLPLRLLPVFDEGEVECRSLNPTSTRIRRRWWKVCLKNMRKKHVLLLIQVYVNTKF